MQRSEFASDFNILVLFPLQNKLWISCVLFALRLRRHSWITSILTWKIPYCILANSFDLRIKMNNYWTDLAKGFRLQIILTSLLPVSKTSKGYMYLYYTFYVIIWSKLPAHWVYISSFYKPSPWKEYNWLSVKQTWANSSHSFIPRNTFMAGNAPREWRHCHWMRTTSALRLIRSNLGVVLQTFISRGKSQEIWGR